MPQCALLRQNIQMESNKSARMHAGKKERGHPANAHLHSHARFRGRLRPFGPFGASTYSEYLTQVFVSIHVCVPLPSGDPGSLHDLVYLVGISSFRFNKSSQHTKVKRIDLPHVLMSHHNHKIV